MKNFANLIVLLIVTLLFSACQNESLEPSIASDTELEEQAAMSGWGNPVFEDNFTNGLGNWNKANRADYNSEFCHYRNSYANIQNTGGTNDGKALRLEARYWYTGTRDGSFDFNRNQKFSGNFFRSGHVKSKRSFTPGRGEEIRFEWRAKLQVHRNNGQYTNWIGASTGAFPALWTVNESNWPTNGEIDVMEAFARKKDGNTSYSSNLFYGRNVGNNEVTRAKRDYWVNDGWRKYEMIWKHNNNRSKEIIIYIDGSQVAYYNGNTDSKLNLDEFSNHNIMMNMNVGDSAGDIWDPYSLNVQRSANLWVDYVKVYRRSL